MSMYQSLMTFYAQVGNQAELVKIVDDIRKNQATIGRGMYIAMASNMAHVGMVEALEVFAEMESKVQRLNENCFRVYLGICESLLVKHVYDAQSSAENRQKCLDAINLETVESMMTQFLPEVPRRETNRISTQLMFIYGAKGDTKKSMEHLDQLISRLNGAVTPMILYRRLIQVGTIQKNYDLVINSYEEALKHHGQSHEPFDNCPIDAMEAYMAKGNVEKALATLEGSYLRICF